MTTTPILLYLLVAFALASIYLYGVYIQEEGNIPLLEAIFALLIGISWPLTLTIVFIYLVIDL